MRFGRVPLAQAAGAVLAHSVHVDGGRLKKGAWLGEAELDLLAQAGLSDVVVARLDTGDLAEDEAAARLGAALASAGDGLRVEDAFTGRANIYSTEAGCFFAERAAVDDLNRIDPAITLATLADGVMVGAGRLVATVKIIPFAVPESAVRDAEALAAKGSMVRVAPATVRRVALVATRLPFLKDTVMDKTARVLAGRLAAYDAILAGEWRVAHDVQAVASAMSEAVGESDLVVVFGASAIVDKADIIPAAIGAAGGLVHRFGMPVDPGNLLLVGEVANIPVIGAPGCARSPAENGFDWVLRRVVHGMPVAGIDLAGMGVGGLLSEIVDRTQPREPPRKPPRDPLCENRR